MEISNKEVDERNRSLHRNMAWERTKGELRSMLHTFRSNGNNEEFNQYMKLDTKIKEFIDYVEGRGLYE